MDNKKLSDNEIIKAMEYCEDSADTDKHCLKCPYCNESYCLDKMMADALSLINRQKAEIERLENNIEQVEESFIDVREMMVGYKVKLDTAKEQTAKDFAERVKTKFDRYGAEHYYYSIVDDVLSEMGVDTNAD